MKLTDIKVRQHSNLPRAEYYSWCWAMNYDEVRWEIDANKVYNKDRAEIAKAVLTTRLKTEQRWRDMKHRRDFYKTHSSDTTYKYKKT